MQKVRVYFGVCVVAIAECLDVCVYVNGSGFEWIVDCV